MNFFLQDFDRVIQHQKNPTNRRDLVPTAKAKSQKHQSRKKTSRLNSQIGYSIYSRTAISSTRNLFYNPISHIFHQEFPVRPIPFHVPTQFIPKPTQHSQSASYRKHICTTPFPESQPITHSHTHTHVKKQENNKICWKSLQTGRKKTQTYVWRRM